MAHHARTRADADWVNLRNLLPAELRDADQKTFLSLNGHEGGNWSPSSPIVIGGAGVECRTNFLLQGGSVLQTLAGSGNRITLADGDYPVLIPAHTEATRTLRTGLVDGFTWFEQWRPDNGTVGFESLFTFVPEGNQAIFPLRVHHNANFASCTITFAVTVSHSTVPGMPKFRVTKCDVNGAITALKTTADAGYSSFTPTPASGAAWYNSGIAKTFLYTCDANQVVDVENFTYWLEVKDEYGFFASAGNRYYEAACVFNAIPDLRFQ